MDETGWLLRWGDEGTGVHFTISLPLNVFDIFYKKLTFLQEVSSVAFSNVVSHSCHLGHLLNSQALRQST